MFVVKVTVLIALPFLLIPLSHFSPGLILYQYSNLQRHLLEIWVCYPTMDCATRLEILHLHWHTKLVMKIMTTITTAMKLFSIQKEGRKLSQKKILALEIYQEWTWMDTGYKRNANDVVNAKAAQLWVIVDSVHPVTAHGHTKCVDSAGVATSWWKQHWLFPVLPSREATLMYRLVWFRQVCIALSSVKSEKDSEPLYYSSILCRT